VDIVFSIIAKRLLVLRWLRTKQYLSELDNIWNTGMVWPMIFEILLMLVMPYPHLYNVMYTE